MADALHMIRQKKLALEERIKTLNLTIETSKIELEECTAKKYDVFLRELHISEIYRLAKLHFPRLRREKIQELDLKDTLELDKWIDRAKSSESLKAIVDAIQELEKYQPIDIRGNLYALVQRIISGGAYHGKKK
jgi:uncharacterized protein YpbB